jgi:2-oxoglutarate ferredoxin oxidoreductase subunit beta
VAFNYDKYLRMNKMPHIWCPGCGHGIVMKSLLRAIDSLGIEKNRILMVSGIGCAGRLPGYVDFNTLHVTHGRALAFATGVKLAKPSMYVIAVCGDGDAVAIGGNHFIHACRRNLHITCIVFNNFIYGMTGGQFSPTTPYAYFTSTTPFGNPDPEFDIVKLSIGAGATFVARSISYNAVQVERFIKRGISHKGFSVIEVIDACYTTLGRRNKGLFKSVIDMIEWQRKNSINIALAKKKSSEELKGKIVLGIFREEKRKEYLEEYKSLTKMG